ncbi:MAG: hypothetical protein H6737_28345 [Alphaproteobacteria bacterium]|nr:hypothetical protein [Alphaproteobacteria bacterium]
MRRAILPWVLLAACEPRAAEDTDVHAVELPGHNECLPAGEAMSDAVCEAVVEHDGRLPTTSANASGTPPDADDPRLTDPEYQWLAGEVERCTCVCCHSGALGGPGVHRWDFDYEPVWIDSANDWVLQVFMGNTDEYDQTLPTDDPARLQAVVERELARRSE